MEVFFGCLTFFVIFLVRIWIIEDTIERNHRYTMDKLHEIIMEMKRK